MFYWRQETVNMFTAMLILFLVDGYLAQEIFDCNSRKNETVYYRVGETISLCCTLPGKECSELNDDDVVRIDEVNRRKWPPSDDAASDTVISCPGVTDETPENGVTDATPGNHTSCGRCSYKFQGDNATLSDGGTYHCYINNDSFGFIDVHIIAKPDASKVLKLSVSDESVMNVEFEKGDCHPWVNDLTVVMAYRKNVTQLCSLNCSLCQDTCTCEYKPTSTAIPTSPVTLTVVVSSPSVDFPIQTTSWTSDFKLFQHIVPSKVEELKLLNFTVDEAIIMFRPTKALLRNIYNMRIASKPLYYKIFLNRTQGFSEVLRVEFQKTVLSVSEHQFQFVAVRFTNLTTFTGYRLSVAGVGGGGEGGSSTLEFTTNKTVPQSPPKVEDFTYSRISGDSKTSSLYLWWQPLPQASRGGSLLFYHVVVTSDNGITLNETTVRSAYTLFDSLPSREPLTVKIWAKNEMGRSKSYSQMDIPAYQDVRPPMYVEYDLDNNMSYVFINITDIEGVEILAIHKCDVSQGSLCATYPYTQIKQVNSSKSFGSGTLMFDMPLATPVTSTTVEVRREVEYFDTEDGGNPFQNPKNLSAYANVTLDVDESEGLWDAATKDTHPRLYLSVQVKGRWLGMVGAKCYFTRKSVKVDLVQSAEQDGSKHYVRFVQHCDPETPAQFLAEHFIIYALTDASNIGECSGPERQKVGEKKNNIFSFNTMDLPPGMKYACVEAVAFNSSTSYTSKTLPYAAVSQSSTGIGETRTILIVVFSLVGALVALGIIYCTGRRCLSRRRHFQEFSPDLLSPDSSSSSETSTDFLMNVVSQGSPRLSRDSGHGTMDNSHRDRGDENTTGQPEVSDTSDASLLPNSNQRNEDNSEHGAPLNQSNNNEHGAPLNQSNDNKHGVPLNQSNDNKHGVPLNQSNDNKHGVPLNQSNDNKHGATFPITPFNERSNDTDDGARPYPQNNQSSYDTDDGARPYPQNNQSSCPTESSCASPMSTDGEEDSSGIQDDSSNTSAEQRAALENFSFDFNPPVGSDSNSTNTS